MDHDLEMHKFEGYEGAEGKLDILFGEWAVTLLENIRVKEEEFFNDFFTNTRFLSKLAEKNFPATGAIRFEFSTQCLFHKGKKKEKM